MVIYELLGHVKQPSVSATPGTTAVRRVALVGTQADKLPTSCTRPKLSAAAQKSKVRSLRAFVLDRPFPGKGERTEMKVLMQDYRVWCAQHGCTPLELSEFLDEIEKICRQVGVEIEVGDDQRVYCVGVKLGNSIAVAVH